MAKSEGDPERKICLQPKELKSDEIFARCPQTSDSNNFYLCWIFPENRVRRTSGSKRGPKYEAHVNKGTMRMLSTMALVRGIDLVVDTT